MFRDGDGVFRGEADGMEIESDVGIGLAEARGGGLKLWFSDGGVAVEELALEVGEIDRIRIHQPEAAAPCGGEVKGGGGVEPAGADEQDGCVFQPQLTGLADLRDVEVAGVAGFFPRCEHSPSVNPRPPDLELQIWGRLAASGLLPGILVSN